MGMTSSKGTANEQVLTENGVNCINRDTELRLSIGHNGDVLDTIHRRHDAVLVESSHIHTRGK